MNFDPNLTSTIFLVATAFSAAFIAALWLSLVFWTYRDIRKRSRDALSHILAVLVVAILFLPGIIIYLILRPQRTTEEEYQQTLEEEALLQTIEDNPLCPGCGRRIQADWVACPSCHTRLRKRCHKCGKLMERAWDLCPSCATAAPGSRRENMTLDDALQTPLPDEGELLEEPGEPG